MVVIRKPPISSKPTFDPPPQQPRAITSKREVDNMSIIDRPPRPPAELECIKTYEGMGNAGRPALLENYVCIAASTQENISFPSNIEEQQEAKKHLQREQRQIKSTLKKYGIDLGEWKLYVSQWA